MRGTNRNAGKSRAVACEPLEARLVFSGEYQPLPAGPWDFTPAPATLYTAKSQLTSSGSRLLLPQTSQATLQARVASPAYADLVFKLEDRGTWFKNRYNVATLALPDVTADDPWRRFAQELKNTLTLYISATDTTKKATYKSTLTTWFNKMASWFGTPTTGAPGAGVPQGDLAESELGSMYAYAYDWLKNDTSFSVSDRTNIRNNLIVLTRAITYAQQNGGGAAMWLTAYEANHNHWNFYALGAAGAALYGDADPTVAAEAATWLNAGVNNSYYISQLANPGGAPTEGWLYALYDSEPVIQWAYLQKQLLNTSVDFVSQPSIKNEAVARLHALLPEARGHYGYNDDYRTDSLSGAWPFHFIASQFKTTDPQISQIAQWVANYTLANTSTTTGNNRYTANYQSLFFYDSTAPQADLATQQTYFAENNLGIYNARSDWNFNANTTFFGFHAGPNAGWNDIYLNGPFGGAGGHTMPDQGNVQFFKGGKPILPSAGYPTQKNQENHNTVLFTGRDGDGASVEQLGGGYEWYSPGYFRNAEDQARVLSESHDGTTHAYLADLGGIYQLKDSRDPSGNIRPDYQRRVVYLESGAVAIIDRISTSQPRDLTFWMPLYDTGTNTPTINSNAGQFLGAKNTLSFTTKDNVSGKVYNFSNITNQTFSVVPYTVNSDANHTPFTESLKRQAVSINATDQTEVVFAVVIDVTGSANAVSSFAADAKGVTLNNRYYAWDRAVRGGASTINFNASQGYVSGQDIQGQSKILGRGYFNASITGLLDVASESGNNLLKSPSVAPPTFGTVRYTPFPAELGVESYDQLTGKTVRLSFDVRLDRAPNTNQGFTAYQFNIGVDGGGTSTGSAANLILRSDGKLSLSYGGGTYVTPSALTVNQFVNVAFDLNYATKTLSFYFNGSATPAVSNVNFAGTGADTFGYLGFIPTVDPVKYLPVSIDNVSVGVTTEGPMTPSGLVATTNQRADVLLTWIDHADNETGYEIQRSELPDFTGITTTTVGTTGANAVTFTDTSAPFSKTLYYRIRAVKVGTATVYSAYTDSVTAKLITAPTLVTLAPASDTGTAGDNKTNLNNSSATKKLTFLVDHVWPGNTVTVYAGSTVIGTATAGAGSTWLDDVAVATNGSYTLSDGTVSISASQTSVGLESAKSPALNVTIDTVASSLASAASSKQHGGSGTFNLPLALGGVTKTIEPRLNGANKIIFTFSEPIRAVDNTLSANEFVITNATFSSATISGSTLTLNLTGVVDRRYSSITLAGISDLVGNVLTGTATLTVGNLYGDVSRNGLVSTTDQQLVKNALLQTVNATNFLLDANASGGFISVVDQQTIKNNLLHGIV